MMSQQSIASLPHDKQAAAMSATERASLRYPSVDVAGHLLHVCEIGGEWEVWLNCEDADFTGVCVSAAPSRQEAVRQAVCVFEAVAAKLQEPPAGQWRAEAHR